MYCTSPFVKAHYWICSNVTETFHFYLYPTVPDTPASCIGTLSYNQSSEMLLTIDNTWDIVPVSQLHLRINLNSTGRDNIACGDSNGGICHCMHVFD